MNRKQHRKKIKFRMNRKQRRKKIKITNSEIDIFKIEALKEFIRFCNKKSFWGRLKIGLLILFKRLNP